MISKSIMIDIKLHDFILFPFPFSYFLCIFFEKNKKELHIWSSIELNIPGMNLHSEE